MIKRTKETFLHKEWCNYLDDYFFKRIYKKQEFRRKIRSLNSFYKDRLLRPLIYHKRVVQIHARHYYFKEKVLKGEKIQHSFSDKESFSSAANSKSLNTDNLLISLKSQRGINEQEEILEKTSDKMIHNKDDISLYFKSLNNIGEYRILGQNFCGDTQYQNLKKLFQKKKTANQQPIIENPPFESQKLGKMSFLHMKQMKNTFSPHQNILKPSSRLIHKKEETPENVNEITISNLLSQLILVQKKTDPRMLSSPKIAFKFNNSGKNESATRTGNSQKVEKSTEEQIKGAFSSKDAEIGFNFNAVLKSSCSQASESKPIEKSRLEKDLQTSIKKKTSAFISSKQLGVSRLAELGSLKIVRKDSFQPLFVNQFRQMYKKRNLGEEIIFGQKRSFDKIQSVNTNPTSAPRRLSVHPKTNTNQYKAIFSKQGSECLHRVQSLRRLVDGEKNQYNVLKPKKSIGDLERKNSETKKPVFIFPRYTSNCFSAKRNNQRLQQFDGNGQKLGRFSIDFKPEMNFSSKNSISRKFSTKSYRSMHKIDLGRRLSDKLNIFDRKNPGISVDSKKQSSYSKFRISVDKKPRKLKDFEHDIPKSSHSIAKNSLKNPILKQFPQKFSLNHLKQKMQVGHMKTDVETQTVISQAKNGKIKIEPINLKKPCGLSQKKVGQIVVKDISVVRTKYKNLT